MCNKTPPMYYSVYLTPFYILLLDVRIESRRVCVKVRNTSQESVSIGEASAAPGEMLVLWEGRLAQGVSVDDSTWCVGDRKIELSLEKAGGSGGLWRKLEE
ncbi:hypothetical protein B484DRAFT_426287 [Ochromonadaceae sp. CCMP2298]|nr:hypothetical protein B484DRAFT_426287 [Ochromonadaceae sp. CCMP2298]